MPNLLNFILYINTSHYNNYIIYINNLIIYTNKNKNYSIDIKP